MYAIVEIAGQQFKVEEGQEIFVHRLQAAEGTHFHTTEYYWLTMKVLYQLENQRYQAHQ